jgi:hypothetical protein
MSTPIVKTYVAEAAVGHRRIVKFGATDGSVLHAAAAADLLIGVVDNPSGAAIAERVDVVRAGLAEVEFGGTVARGARVTSDANGRAVAAAPAAGANASVIGIAERSSVSGDIGLILVLPGVMQG